MRKTILSVCISACLVLVCVSLYAQAPADTAALVLPYPALLEDMRNVKIVQDSAITRLMQEKIAGVERGVCEMPGFRVQVYSSNRQGVAKTEAMQVQEKFEQAVTQPVYIISTPPFIKVRIGDFRTQEQAMTFKQELLLLFPDMAGEIYVVRDEHIKVKL